jgi:hypothetical protein
MVISIEELKSLKRFPTNETVLVAKDKATITLLRIPYGAKKEEKPRYLFEARIQFTYENGREYEVYVREKNLKKTIEKAFIKFEQRNNQMKNYERQVDFDGDLPRN